ncbi:MAG: succinate dehydrogenase, cytochrome b556 subunit, partial [Alphaproteobacteria bacterium]
HLQVYRWQLTMLTSILHRLSGVGLALGLLLVTWWLAAAASGPEYFDMVHGIMGSWIGRLILLGFTAALYFHLCNGIRHLLWDIGHGFEIGTAKRLGYLVFSVTVLATLVTFMVGYGG